jgi:hypothetical protein
MMKNGISFSTNFGGTFWSKKHHRIKWKNRIYLLFWCAVKNMNRNLHASFYLMNKVFLSLSVSHDFKTLQMSLGKHQIWPKIKKIDNINVGFCVNSFDKSLVVSLKYTVCEFYDCQTLFDEMTIFWIRKKKKSRLFKIFNNPPTRIQTIAVSSKKSTTIIKLTDNIPLDQN